MKNVNKFNYYHVIFFQFLVECKIDHNTNTKM